MESRPYRPGDRRGRRGSLLPPPGAGGNPPDFDPYQITAWDPPEQPRAAWDPPEQDPAWRPERSGRSGQYAPAASEFGHAPGPDSRHVRDSGPRPFTEQEPSASWQTADLPNGSVGPGRYGELQDRVPSVPPRRPSPGDRMTAAGTGYRDYAAGAGYRDYAAGAGYPDNAAGTGYPDYAAGTGYPDYAVTSSGSQPDLSDSFPPHRRRRRRRVPIVASVLAVAVLAGIAGIALFANRHSNANNSHSSANNGHAPGAAAPGSTAVKGRTARGPGRGAAGPRSISIALVFPHAQVVADGIKFGRVTAVMNKPCAQAARGAFATALTSARCRRVVRAAFVDSARHYAVTVGVAELPNRAAVRQANRSAKFGPDVWFTGLDGRAGSGAAAVSKTIGLGYQTLYRQYIVYALATYSDRHNPTGHTAAVKTLKDLAKSFTIMARKPLITPGR